MIVSLCLLFIVVGGAYADDPPDEAFPPPATLPDTDNDAIHNILIIGSATEYGDINPGLTDTLMIVSVNLDAGSVSLLSIPRDLYVYVPSLERMTKINQVYFYGQTGENADGIESLRDTVAYNLGLNVDSYIRIDFRDFEAIIDAVGGIDIAVDCVIEDWKLIDRELDKQDPDNWEMYTLQLGRRHLDGELALWYVRSRRTSSDLDRNRRQQDVLRALWRKISADGLLDDAPALWQSLTEIVETDLSTGTMLELLTVAAEIDLAQVQYFRFKQPDHMTSGYTEDEGRFIFNINREGVTQMVRQMLTPPTRSQLQSEPPLVGIVNVTGVYGMGQVAAQRLEVEGFRAVVLDEPASPREFNKLVDYTGSEKGKPYQVIQRVFRITDDGVEHTPQPARELDYKLYLGERYLFWSCTYPVQQPRYEPEGNEGE